MDVSFHEESGSGASVQRKASGLTGLVIRLGLARDEREAPKALLAVTALLLLAAVAVWLFTGPSEPALSEQEYEQQAQDQQRFRAR